jgi:hypothetical protein
MFGYYFVKNVWIRLNFDFLSFEVKFRVDLMFVLKLIQTVKQILLPLSRLRLIEMRSTYITDYKYNLI